MAYLLFDDILIDDDTGEIVEAPPISDDALTASLVARLHMARTMAKEHARDVAALTAVLLRRLDRRGIYGDYTATIRQDSYTSLDRTEFSRFIDAAELTRDDMLAILHCVTSLDRDAVRELPPHLQEPISDCYTSHDRKAWIDTRPVKRPPARTVERRG